MTCSCAFGTTISPMFSLRARLITVPGFSVSAPAYGWPLAGGAREMHLGRQNP